MVKMTPERLAELRAVAEAAEPMMVFGGLTQTTFVTMEKSDVLALIAALEAKTAEVEQGLEFTRQKSKEAARKRRELERERDEARAEVERRPEREFVRAVIADRDAAEAALERVRALHQKRRAYADDWDTCTCGYDEYPCPTIQAIEGDTVIYDNIDDFLDDL